MVLDFYEFNSLGQKPMHILFVLHNLEIIFVTEIFWNLFFKIVLIFSAFNDYVYLHYNFSVIHIYFLIDYA